MSDIPGKTGLVLEGGAMRGLFTAGALDVFMRRGIKFDALVGVSAGACFGCNYKSGQIGRVIRYNKRFAKDPRYCSLKSLFLTGDLFGAEFCYRTLPKNLDIFDSAAFEASHVEFHVVATDALSAKPVYRRLDKIDDAGLDWIRASASMPIVSRPVEIDGGLYLDGGLSDAVPLKYFESIGYGRNVVITTRPRGYRKFMRKSVVLLKPFLRRYPQIYRSLKTRHLWYNETLEYVEDRVRSGDAVLIAPEKPLEISRICHDPEVMQRVYDLGREAAESSLASNPRFFGAL